MATKKQIRANWKNSMRNVLINGAYQKGYADAMVAASEMIMAQAVEIWRNSSPLAQVDGNDDEKAEILRYCAQELCKKAAKPVEVPENTPS